ncbi:hypothetical protein [Burkholderia cenocepacia]|uniref:hypothetical protein n=1 Tax=Burkholderia cenocepacia TaxID=95486 RepID=UPI001B9E6425|nr:hypothetical protein [Burkholderia cenocepacia]MBR8498368.1 hypothetical protein [Burkholderia cenocepacia]
MFKMNKPLEKKLDKSLEKKQGLEHTTLEKPEAEKFLSKDGIKKFAKDFWKSLEDTGNFQG